MDPGPALSHPFEVRPNRTLLALSLPVMLSLIAEPLAGIVDTAFVERLGVGPAAALGAATVLFSGFVWIFNFLGVGTQTEIAQVSGRGRSADAGRVASLAMVVAVLLGASAAAASWLSIDAATAWMTNDEPVRVQTRIYLEIRLLGLPAALVLFTAFGALRGLQDMRTPLWIAGAMSAANVVLDALLIFGHGPVPALGIAGAAWATVASQGLAAVWAVAVVIKRLGWSPVFELGRARALFVVGRDMMIRTGLLLLFLVLCTRVALQMSAEVGAAHQAIRQIWMLIAFLLDAYAATAQSLVAYFLGAGNLAEARRVARISLGWGLATGVVLSGVLLLAESGVALLLVPEPARPVFAAAWPVFALTQPISAVSFVTDGIHWGSRDYGYLRNGMLASGVVGIALLERVSRDAGSGLELIWLVTAVWLGVRAALGWIRIWPGIGGAPLALVRQSV